MILLDREINLFHWLQDILKQFPDVSDKDTEMQVLKPRLQVCSPTAIYIASCHVTFWNYVVLCSCVESSDSRVMIAPLTSNDFYKK